MAGYPNPDPAPGEALDAERVYERAERHGKALNDVLCVECPDPGLCAANADCPREGRSW